MVSKTTLMYIATLRLCRLVCCFSICMCTYDPYNCYKSALVTCDLGVGGSTLTVFCKSESQVVAASRMLAVRCSSKPRMPTPKLCSAALTPASYSTKASCSVCGTLTNVQPRYARADSHSNAVTLQRSHTKRSKAG